MFFPKLRRRAKWVFLFLALAFGFSFIFFGFPIGPAITLIVAGLVLRRAGPWWRESEGALAPARA